MRRVLHLLYKDWERAPVSGTLFLMSNFAAGLCLWHVNVDRALLFLILGATYCLQRGPMEKSDGG